MKEDVFVMVRYALAEPKKETGSFEEQDFTFNFVVYFLPLCNFTVTLCSPRLVALT